MNAKKFFLVFTMSLILSAAASAQQKSENGELLARLERMASEGDWRIRTSTGAPHQKWLLHQRRVRRLIDQLKSGQSVDPKEIDEILKEHSR